MPSQSRSWLGGRAGRHGPGSTPQLVAIVCATTPLPGVYRCRHAVVVTAVGRQVLRKADAGVVVALLVGVCDAVVVVVLSHREAGLVAGGPGPLRDGSVGWPPAVFAGDGRAEAGRAVETVVARRDLKMRTATRWWPGVHRGVGTLRWSARWPAPRCSRRSAGPCSWDAGQDRQVIHDEVTSMSTPRSLLILARPKARECRAGCRPVLAQRVGRGAGTRSTPSKRPLEPPRVSSTVS
jgi:hypothetical protein